MLQHNEIIQSINMISKQHLDVRTITMGINLLDCTHENEKIACTKIYDKITKNANISKRNSVFLLLIKEFQ